MGNPGRRLFHQFEWATPQGIGRLNPDGSLDGTFDARVDSKVDSILEQPDGKILVAGDFRTIAGQARTNIARLNGDGTLDSSFSVHLNRGAAHLALQPDGKLLVGGYFTSVNLEIARVSSGCLPMGVLTSPSTPD